MIASPTATDRPQDGPHPKEDAAVVPLPPRAAGPTALPASAEELRIKDVQRWIDLCA